MTGELDHSTPSEPNALPLNVWRALALVDYFIEKESKSGHDRGFTIAERVGSVLQAIGVCSEFKRCYWTDTNGRSRYDSPQVVEVEGYLIGSAGTVGWEDTINRFYDDVDASVRFYAALAIVTATRPPFQVEHEINNAVDWLRAQEEASALTNNAVGGHFVRKKARL